MKEKRPRGRGRGPSLRLWKATRLLLYAAWTFYPQIQARQLFIRSQPRKTGHLVSLHVSRGGGWGGGREEDPEKSRVYNSRLNFWPLFLTRLHLSLMIPRRLIACTTHTLLFVVHFHLSMNWNKRSWSWLFIFSKLLQKLFLHVCGIWWLLVIWLLVDN